MESGGQQTVRCDFSLILVYRWLQAPISTHLGPLEVVVGLDCGFDQVLPTEVDDDVHSHMNHVAYVAFTMPVVTAE